ncbi:MerC domain-containing protein [Haloferula sp.]|uniref:MerC domain-containing protein n=1 Tax=Haloferula sp. TaxID=2497595 RepID=UPI00329AC50F
MKRKEWSTGRKDAIVRTGQALLGLLLATLAPAQDVGEGMAVLPVEKVRQPAPLFYSVEAKTNATAQGERITGSMDLKVRVLQGRAKNLTIGLNGDGEVLSVTGSKLISWSVRKESDGSRFLDLKPKLPQEKPQPLFEGGLFNLPNTVPLVPRPPKVDGPKEFGFKVAFSHDFDRGDAVGLLLPAPGKAAGFSSKVTLNESTGFRAKLLELAGLSRIDSDLDRFEGTGSGKIRLKVVPQGGELPDIELINPMLVGKVGSDGESVSFVLSARVQVNQEDSSVTLFQGVALGETTAGDGWHVRLANKGDSWFHELVGSSAGAEGMMELPFEVAVKRKGDWRMLDFRLPAGVVVPVRIEGMSELVSFSKEEPVVPERRGEAWEGHLNAAGHAKLAWKEGAEDADGALFFSSTEITEVRVGAGLVRQASDIGFQVLQGKINSIRMKIEGSGEVLAVSGEQVLGWNPVEEGEERFLAIELSRPIEGSGRLTVQAQAPLGGFPVKAQPMRFIPDGALRHSGYVRVANEGAVRLEIVESKGMMQLSPEQFPGGKAAKGLRQVFVYRFPSSSYDYTVAADQVLPEVSISEVTIHEMGETDRRILSDLELDIREAPLREWTVGIPKDFAVAEVSGASVADYSVAGEAKGETRQLKILFKSAVAGRQLVSLRLEKNQGSETGDWTLPVLQHSDARSTRGFVGVASAPGYRIVPGTTGGLAETPVDYFPKKIEGLQQGFRIREEKWSATMKVEALGQSVQADVFHLYSLKEGVAYGSVVVNYFVVGAPASEWRLRVPEGIGNIDVTGQSVGRDWRQEEDVLIVPLVRPALGASTILVTFEQPMSARGGEISPGEVRPLEVQSERGYIQVTSPLQVDASIGESKGSILRIDASELPAEYRLLSSAPTLEAWQYTAADPEITMNVSWYEVDEPVGEVIDFSSLKTHVSRDGQVATTARFFARSKGATTLEVSLPVDAKLWETRVSGERVNARRDGAKTLIPLSSQADPNEPIEVVLRYGEEKTGKSVTLLAPGVGTAVAVVNWTVTGDEDRRLVPKGGTGELVRPVMTETGFEWIATRGRMAAPMVLFLAALGFVLRRFKSIGVLGLVAMVGAMVWSFMLANEAMHERRANVATLEYTAPAVLVGDDLVVELANVEAWKALTSSSGMMLLLAGVGVLGWALLRAVGRDKYVLLCVGAGLALIAFGLLAQHGGAVLFFSVLGLALLVSAVIPWVGGYLKGVKRGGAVAASLILLAAMAPRVEAAIPDGSSPAESMKQSWVLHEGRLKGEVAIRVRANEAGERFQLLKKHAVLTAFNGAGLKAVKGKEGYFVVAESPGVFTGKAEFEKGVTNPRAGWQVPTGVAASQEIQVEMTEPGWSFEASNAARVTQMDYAEADLSGAVIVLGVGNDSKISIRPLQRDASNEKVQFYTEVSDLFVPGPGVVNGLHRIAIRPARGVVRELTLNVPEDFTVGDVSDGPVGRWRFNPETRELKVAVEPAQENPFAFSVATQRATEGLPVDLKLVPMRVVGSEGAVGMLGLAFGGEAQAEGITVEGMGAVNLDDFDARLLPRNAKSEPLALLQKAYRYGVEEASISLKVTSVAPEIRAEVTQTLSLGEDRMVLAADLLAKITRAGVFKLLVEIPEGLEVESVTGASLSHWTESPAAGKRLISLNLNGRTLGEQTFSISLSSPSPGSLDSWEVPRLVLREATRQRGTLTVVPERGLQVRAVARTNVSQLDPRDAGVPRPGALAFRLLQSDWALSLAVKELDSWVTAQALQEVTLREGQVLTRARVIYRIENAAQKSLRVRLPGLNESAAATVRATGPAVGDFVPVEGEEGLWEIRFQRGVAGETAVDIEFQRQSNGEEARVMPLELVDIRQSSHFVSIKTGGRLDATISDTPRGWQKTDMNGLPSALRGERRGDLADFLYRVAEVEGALVVSVARHALAESERLRVKKGNLRTLVSSEGSSITTVELHIEASSKATLKLALPAGVTPFNLAVNGEGVPLVRSGTEWLFYVTPSPVANQPALVEFSYSHESDKRGLLSGPQLGVPLENLIWDVFVPEGWLLAESRGDFQLVSQDDAGSLSLQTYLAMVDARRAHGKAEAVAELDQGYAWLRAGEQGKAGQVLGKAARNGFLDEASNEDARVQFRNLKMQQAVLGLNTRRQRNYLDNRFSGDEAENAQLEQAAEENPILQGRSNFDPKQFDRLMVGNSAEVTTSLKTIAQRIVEQQLEVEAAPGSLELELPGHGRVLRFSRSLQVKTNEPMQLELKLERERPSGWLFGGIVAILAACVLVTGWNWKSKPEEA